MLRLVSPETVVAPATSAANTWEGNAQGNVILFEPSTSEHISARTIFDPITALAPAADCRTFAIGYVISGLSQHPANSTQLPQWLHLDRDTPAILHDSPYSNHPKIPLPYCGPGLAWLIIKAKVGDAGGSNRRWRSQSMERSKSTP
jgi:hypothetical protein